MEILKVSEAAELLGIKMSTLYGWVHQRKIPFRKHGGRLVFSRNDLLKWSQLNVVEPVGCRGHNAGCSLKTKKNRADPSSSGG